MYLMLNRDDDRYYVFNVLKDDVAKDKIIELAELKDSVISKVDLTQFELLNNEQGIYGRILDDTGDINLIVAGCKAFKQEEINIRVSKMLEEFLAGKDHLELITLAIQAREAEEYISSKGTYHSSILKLLAAANSVKVDDMALLILDKSRQHEEALIRFKVLKDHLESKLQYMEMLEEFQSFDVEVETKNYLKHLGKKDQVKDCVELSVSKSKDDEIAEVISAVLSKNNKKRPTKPQPEEKQRDIAQSDNLSQELTAK